MSCEGRRDGPQKGPAGHASSHGLPPELFDAGEGQAGIRLRHAVLEEGNPRALHTWTIPICKWVCLAERNDSLDRGRPAGPQEKCFESTLSGSAVLLPLSGTRP